MFVNTVRRQRKLVDMPRKLNKVDGSFAGHMRNLSLRKVSQETGAECGARVAFSSSIPVMIETWTANLHKLEAFVQALKEIDEVSEFIPVDEIGALLAKAYDDFEKGK